MPVQRPYNPNARRIAELMQADLAKVGVKAEIVKLRVGRVPQAREDRRAPDGAMLGWTGDNGDPDNFFVPLRGCAAARPGGGNASKWCNQDFDALINKAKRSSDQAERTKLYEQAQVILHQEAPWASDRPLGGVHADAQEGHRLHDEPVRQSSVRRRRHRRITSQVGPRAGAGAAALSPT